MASFFVQHRELLDQALAAITTRGYWSPFPEVPSGKFYGEDAKPGGQKAFAGRLNTPFELDGHPGAADRVGAERSPYGFDLGVTYPKASVDELIDAARTAGRSWACAGIEDRVGVCLEILGRLNKRSFEMANAVMHTSGQAFVMAFQAGGPHAQDRGLEGVAYAYDEMRRVPGQVLWEKPQGRQDPIRLTKTFKIIPRGIGLVIGCSTFPTWNSYAGLFASLATGNAVIVKPHPGAILPLAITVEVAREVLKEAGFDPNTVLLAADAPGAPITKELVQHPATGIIDYTGGPAFGEWLKANADGAQVFVEQAGVNSVVVDSTDDFTGMTQNLAFSLSLYSGQMCTAPQNVYVPRGGIETGQGHKSFDEVAEGIAAAVQRLLGEPERAVAVLGALQNEATLARVKAAETGGEADVVLPSQPVAHPDFENARSVTPVILKARSAAEGPHTEEQFGPISYVVPTDDTKESIACASGLARHKGAITAAIWSTDPATLEAAEAAFAEAGVSLSCNLTGNVYVNQSAAFSDYHVSGANPAGTACLTDSAFVANRFRVVAVRVPEAA